MNEAAFNSFSPLHTSRLVLRQLTPEDAEPIFRLRTDEKVNAMIGRKAAENLHAARDFINQTNQRITDKQGFYWAICFEEKLAGTICLFSLDREMNSAEIGFEMLPEFRRKGFMQESLQAVLDFAFQKLQLHTLIAVVNPVNINSLTLIQKNRFLPATGMAIDKDPNDLAFLLPNPVQAEQ
jgi:ribosomal-protein-alanine N-acetyltransferase